MYDFTFVGSGSVVTDRYVGCSTHFIGRITSQMMFDSQRSHRHRKRSYFSLTAVVAETEAAAVVAFRVKSSGRRSLKRRNVLGSPSNESSRESYRGEASFARLLGLDRTASSFGVE